MNIKIRENASYALACVTSMGLRITPADRMAVHNSNRFLLQATSAETNVLNVTSSLGRECLALTRFVEGSPMAAFIKAQLRARNIAYEAKEVPQGGPWGYRHQFNVADAGFGAVVNPIVDLINQLMGPLLAIVGAVGALYCVVLGVKFCFSVFLTKFHVCAVF